MVEGARLEIVLPSTGYQGSNPCLSAKKSESQDSDFFIQAAGLASHHASACISSTKADRSLPLLYIITRTRAFRILLRLDDIHGYAVMIYRNKLRMIYTPCGVILCTKY